MLARIFRPNDFFALPSYFHASKRQIGSVGPRVSWCDAYNLPGTDPRVVARVMEATSASRPRCRHPLMHLVVTWHPDDQPTKEEMRRIVRRLLRKLRLSGHHVYVVGHGDRAHPHLHCLVCRIHPGTGEVADMWRIKQRIARSLRRLERIYGWTENASWLAHLPGQHPPDRTQSLTGAEYRRWARTGFSTAPECLPLQWVIQLRAGDVFKAFAQDFDREALEANLAALGYRLEQRFGKLVGKTGLQLRGHVIVAEDGRQTSVSRVDSDAPTLLMEPKVARAARLVQAYAALLTLHAEAMMLVKQLGPGRPGPGRSEEQQQIVKDRLHDVNRELGSGVRTREARVEMRTAMDGLSPTPETTRHMRRLAGNETLARVATYLPTSWQHAVGHAHDDIVPAPGGLGR